MGDFISLPFLPLNISMKHIVSFDVISDLNLTDADAFDWQDHVTSLNCIVAGNISQHLDIVRQTLLHLSSLYASVFYIDGGLEHPDLESVAETQDVIRDFCNMIPRVFYLYGNAIVVDGLAVIGVNGWYANRPRPDDETDILRNEILRIDNTSYLNKTIASLQKHPDVLQILVVTGCLPAQELMFGEVKHADVPDPLGPAQALANDSQHKIKTWVYGGYPADNDTVIENIRYVSNPCNGKQPYWAKRVEVSILPQP